MDIFSLFTLCGGLAFFLYGMSVLSSRLEKLAGGKLEQLLKKMTGNPIKVLLLGEKGRVFCIAGFPLQDLRQPGQGGHKERRRHQTASADP